MSLEKIDLQMIEVPNPSKDNLHPMAVSDGFNDRSLKRLIFRLNYLENAFAKRNAVLRDGNIATLTPELFVTNSLIADLIDIVREALTLCRESISRQEQGLISPPNAPKADDKP